MSNKPPTSTTKQEETPTMVIEAPFNYERTHELAQCPLCNNPNPVLDMYMPERYLGYFDIKLYSCNTICNCNFYSDFDPITTKVTLKPHNHKFSAKHELLSDADHLKIYDRTHFKDVW
jgi:ssDNA-binding Zn-finger/Zn-ribbon topoisomerase 1